MFVWIFVVDTIDLGALRIMSAEISLARKAAVVSVEK